MFKVIFFVVSITLLLQGCASPKVSMSMLMPATSSEAAKLRRIAVLPFKGRSGHETAEKLEARLVNIHIDDGPWFDVYERERLQSALKEMRLGRSGLVDAETAARIGRFIGVQGIFIGSVDQRDIDKNTYYRDEKYCAVENKKGKCKRWEKRSVRCRSRDAAFGFTAKVVDVETARVAYSRSVRKTRRDTTCSSGFGWSDETAMDSLRDRAIRDFARHVAPHYAVQEIAIKDGADGLKGQQTDLLKAGVTFAKESRMDRACKLWQQALNAGGASMALYYDLGLCEEQQGDMDEAEAWYTRADSLLMKPDEEVSKALQRVRAKAAARRKLQRQMQ